MDPLISVVVLDWLSLILIGAVVGVMVGMTGVGGGSLMTPILTLGLGYPPLVAVGTDLCFAAITKSAGVWAHRRSGNINGVILRRLLEGSALGLVFGIALMTVLDAEQANSLLRPLIGVTVGITGLILLWQTYIRRQANPSPVNALSRDWLAMKTRVVGMLIAMLVVLTSIGAGAIGMTALIWLYPTLSQSRLAATDIAYAVPLTVVASLVHIVSGNVDWGLLLGLLLGSIPGITVGAMLVSRLPELVSRGLLVALLLAVSLKMLVG